MLQVPADPNWFYSSIAQSGAAVVGLLGGVLATRLQTQFAEARAARAALAAAVSTYRDEVEEMEAPVARYCRSARDYVYPLALAEDRKETHAELPPRRHLRGNGISSAERVAVDSQTAEELAERSRGAVQLRESFDAALTTASRIELERLGTRLEELRATSKDAEVRGVAQTARQAVEQLLLPVRHLEAATSIKTALVVLVVLTLLCGSGVLWPLSFLAAWAGWSKPTMLILFGVGLVALLGYIFFQIVTIKRVARVGEITSFEGP